MKRMTNILKNEDTYSNIYQHQCHRVTVIRTMWYSSRNKLNNEMYSRTY